MNWRKLLTVAGEILIDLVTGKLERRARALDSERIAQASREAGCWGCKVPEMSDMPGYGHTCGRPHMAREGVRGYWCGGVGSLHPCSACRTSKRMH